jgi:hypothetical protein
MKKITLLFTALLFGFAAIAQTIIIEEGFNDVTTLVGSEFEIYNASDAPDGSVSQGNETIFEAYDGDPDSFAGMNYQATSGSTVDLYLVTPAVELKNGDLVQFWTRTVETSGFPDRLEVRLDPTGDGTAPEEGDQGAYTELLAEINPDLEAGGYPEEWTQIVAEVTGITGTVETRAALRYWVTDGGPTGANSNYIGIDALEVVSTALSVDDNIFADFTYFVDATSNLQLSANNVLENVTIFNANGQRALTQNLNATQGSVDVASFSTGVYIATATINGKTRSFKFIK